MTICRENVSLFFYYVIVKYYDISFSLFDCVFSAERYDPLTSTWTSIAAMSTRRRYVRVATLGKNYIMLRA